ncbi:MAG: DUF3866 family protein [Solirubrobacterales bacterium]
MLSLRRGTVVATDGGERVTHATVRLDDGAERTAIAYPELTGPLELGDDVVVNVEAQDLGLGSGGFDLVHVNLARLPSGSGSGDAHVMKLNYTSLQHAVSPVEEGLDRVESSIGLAVGVLALHGQLAATAHAFAQVADGGRLGYVQTAGGALPGWLSDTVAELLERELLVDHVTAAPCFGGAHESITVEGALDAGARKLGWDAALVGPGPGILGSASAFGHGGLVALHNANAAIALGCRVVLIPRLSSGDPRERHRGLSHHSATVAALLPAAVAFPLALELSEDAAAQVEESARRNPTLEVERISVAELADEYLASGLPASTMGRAFEQDRDFFLSALAAGSLLARTLSKGGAT